MASYISTYPLDALTATTAAGEQDVSAILGFIAGFATMLLICVYVVRFVARDMEEEIDFLREWVEEVEADRDLATQKALQIEAELKARKLA